MGLCRVYLLCICSCAHLVLTAHLRHHQQRACYSSFEINPIDDVLKHFFSCSERILPDGMNLWCSTHQHEVTEVKADLASPISEFLELEHHCYAVEPLQISPGAGTLSAHSVCSGDYWLLKIIGHICMGTCFFLPRLLYQKGLPTHQKHTCATSVSLFFFSLLL